MTKHFVMFATSVVLITGSIASAKSESPSDYQKSGAPTALQSTTPDRPPVVTLPEANAPMDQGNGNWDPPPVTSPTTQH